MGAEITAGFSDVIQDNAKLRPLLARFDDLSLAELEQVQLLAGRLFPTFRRLICAKSDAGSRLREVEDVSVELHRLIVARCLRS